ncbi:MAG: sensor histidine kinase [Bacillales bacterium]|nr:sensor histidine kinase [Bacillales bacterium]
MMFWRSIVGKLWITILLLVSFVLFILTILLLEYFENYNLSIAKKALTQQTEKAHNVVTEYNDKNYAYYILKNTIQTDSEILIIYDNKQSVYVEDPKDIPNLTAETVSKEEVFKNLNKHNKIMVTTIKIKSKNSSRDYELLVVGKSFRTKENVTGAIFSYEPVEIINKSSRDAAKFIIVTALLAIFLTTVFAFFLSTRITAPLRSMREAVFEIARGRFDTKVPILTHDEIGELAMAFNQMARQLKFNVNALKHEKEQLRSILSSMADGVLTISKEGEITALNSPAEKFMQLWYYEYGHDVDDDKELPDEVLTLFNSVISEAKEKTIEVSFQGYNWVMIMSPLYSQTDVRGVVALIRDMTEERKLEKLRKDFIANVSHELRTPIAMLQGYSEAIIDDIAGSEEEKKELAQIIYDETLRMGRLVSELLDLARMESGNIELEKIEVSLKPFFEKVIRKFQGLANDKKINLNLEFSNSLNNFVFDPDRIEQVLTNLIDNAIRHTPENGEVILSVIDNETGIIFEIRDTGSGIPQEDLPFVFERFYKADKARTRGRSGTGLGLSIVKNIIIAHKGRITVDSVLNKGTIFTVYLPKSNIN